MIVTYDHQNNFIVQATGNSVDKALDSRMEWLGIEDLNLSLSTMYSRNYMRSLIQRVFNRHVAIMPTIWCHKAETDMFKMLIKHVSLPRAGTIHCFTFASKNV
jgi:hypothetical protein